QQRAVLQQLMSSPDPAIQAALSEPANLGFIKSLIGLGELVVPGEDARNKQLREIQQLLLAAPVTVGDHGPITSTIPVDELLDNHAAEFEECRRWSSSDAGQIARAQNPAGFANVRAHAAEHAAALVRQQALATNQATESGNDDNSESNTK